MVHESWITMFQWSTQLLNPYKVHEAGGSSNARKLHQEVYTNLLAETGEKWMEIKMTDIQFILASLEKLKIIRKVPDGKPTYDTDPYNSPWELV